MNSVAEVGDSIEGITHSLSVFVNGVASISIANYTSDIIQTAAQQGSSIVEQMDEGGTEAIETLMETKDSISNGLLGVKSTLIELADVR